MLIFDCAGLQIRRNGVCYDSGKPEFVAVYGRRRIGKTFLVRQYFKDQFDFYTTGIYEGIREEQLAFFCKRLNAHSGGVFPVVNNWFDAFDQLQTYLSGLHKRRIVLFIDELPWLDTPKSRFTKALELFWNSWGCQQERLMLVVWIFYQIPTVFQHFNFGKR